MSTTADVEREARPAEAPVSEADLARLLELVGETERLQAGAVELAGRLAGAGVAEASTGLPLELLLAAKAGLCGGDRHMLITAGEVLETMPVLAAAHRTGRVSWGQVRAIVAEVRRRSLEDRAVVDARIGATLDAQGPQGSWDPDALVEAVRVCVEELRSRRSVERSEQRREEANRLWAQQGFDGRVHGGFAYDPVTAATVLGAIAAEQGKPLADEDGRAPEVPTPQQRSAADALAGICADRLAGGGERAKPAYVIDVRLADLIEGANLPGRVRLRLPGAPPRVTAKKIAADAADGARVRVVVTNGAAPLAVSSPVATDAGNLDVEAARQQVRTLRVPAPQRPGIAALVAAVNRALTQPDLARAAAGERPLCDPALLDAEDVLTATRVAVAARDGGCRFFGCRDPVDWTDVHHLDDRPSGARRHHPDRLVSLCRPHHRLTHERGWVLHLDPATGMLTGRRGSLVWQTLPRGAPLARAPDPPRPPPRHRHTDQPETLPF